MASGYQIKDSPLHRVGPRKLAELLGYGNITALDALANRTPSENYSFFEIDDRSIQCPRNELDKVQRKISSLLGRIQPPEYLFSGVKFRSYRLNAEYHYPNRNSSAFTMDIRRFFPSVTATAVWKCFVRQFECDQDVASVLTKLTTVNHHLPTGSSVSTILSFFAHRPMFDQISALAIQNELLFSVYVDDLTFSGPKADKRFAKSVRRVIRSHGLMPHPEKTKYYRATQPKLITGVILCDAGTRLPNSRRKRIHEDFVQLSSFVSDDERDEVIQRLMGRLSEAGALEPRFISLRSRLAAG